MGDSFKCWRRKTQNCVQPRFGRALFALKFLVLALTGWMVLIMAIVGCFSPLFISLFAYAVGSIVFRLGWVVPCTVLGIFCGIAMDLHVKGGSIEAQMWETVRSIIAGFVVGLLAGIVLDGNSQVADHGDIGKSQSTDTPPPLEPDHA